MNWEYENPKKAGKYIVQTKTPMGNTNTLESTWTGKNWSFNNQKFFRYLSQRERDYENN